MKKRTLITTSILLICWLLSTTGCQQKFGLGIDPMTGSKDTTQVPSVKLETKVLPPMKIVSVLHEVFTEEDLGKALNTGYVNLCEFINKHRLPSSKVMAFYYTYDMPYIVEAAIEVDSFPPVLDSAIGARIVPGGEVLIAHYKGPYEQAAIAYHAIYKWLDDNHRSAREIPFEVYLNDPITIRNKNDLRTDIYQFIK
ncbi:MAG: GyrI-like domain-containing protein [Niastella sp.]|nr:GyrI-like domain-containing protein [Niastella sp.]